MSAVIDNLVEDFYSWMRLNTLTHYEQSTGWGLISTPFIGLNNDHIALSVKLEGEEVVLSDDGDTFENLLLEGVAFDKRSKTRLKLRNEILRNFGVEVSTNNELVGRCPKADFPQYAHNFVQAIKELNDLKVLSTKQVARVFNEDVRTYFDGLSLNYIEDLFLKSNDGLSIKYDFIVPQKQQEILVRSFNRMNEGFVKQFFYDSDNVSSVRRKETIALAIINDDMAKPNTGLLDAFKNRSNTQFLLWSERFSEANKQLLVA